MRAQPDRDYRPENRRSSLLTPTREVWDPRRIARRMTGGVVGAAVRRWVNGLLGVRTEGGATSLSVFVRWHRGLPESWIEWIPWRLIQEFSYR